jgi:tetratricopeptide (TPR) repeat protein
MIEIAYRGLSPTHTNDFGPGNMRQLIIAAALAALSVSVAQAGTPGNCAQLQDAKLTVSSCTAFLDTHPDSSSDQAVAYFYRGTALFMTDQLDPAIADLGRAIEADPSWAPAYNNRARALAGKGELAKAIADYDALIALGPGNPAGYVNRALAYVKLKELDHALADLKKADELKPNTPFTIYNIGEIYENKGDRAQAEAQYRRALALTPRNQIVIDGLKRIGATP